MAANITAGLSKLNPFSRSKTTDEDDKGEEIQPDSVGGGGHASRKSKITKDQLRVSHALKSFLIKEKVLSEHDAGLDSDKPSSALRELLDQSHINVPREVTDRSHALSEYYISSSHNTYLVAHQLYGTSAAVAYETALKTGARCVEIDAWDNDDDPREPKVTHGYTLASNIPFRTVCETMRDVHDHETREAQDGYRAAPMMISLENHCGAEGQQRLADVMIEVFGDRLLSKRVRDEGSREEQGAGDHVRLEELGSKICVIVEYHFPAEEDDDDDSDSSEDEAEDDEKSRMDRLNYKKKKKEAFKGIIPTLADLGVYAQSVKPRDKSWLRGELREGPHDHLINVSESALSSLMPEQSSDVSKHNAQHLMVRTKGMAHV